jgi:hypothetical protein
VAVLEGGDTVPLLADTRPLGCTRFEMVMIYVNVHRLELWDFLTCILGCQPNLQLPRGIELLAESPRRTTHCLCHTLDAESWTLLPNADAN